MFVYVANALAVVVHLIQALLQTFIKLSACTEWFQTIFLTEWIYIIKQVKGHLTCTIRGVIFRLDRLVLLSIFCVFLRYILLYLRLCHRLSHFFCSGGVRLSTGLYIMRKRTISSCLPARVMRIIRYLQVV